MTLSARLNQITQRYPEVVMASQTHDLCPADLELVRRALVAIEVTPTIIRNLDALGQEPHLCEAISRMSFTERLALVEEVGL